MSSILAVSYFIIISNVYLLIGLDTILFTFVIIQLDSDIFQINSIPILIFEHFLSIVLNVDLYLFHWYINSTKHTLLCFIINQTLTTSKLLNALFETDNFLFHFLLLFQMRNVLFNWLNESYEVLNHFLINVNIDILKADLSIWLFI